MSFRRSNDFANSLLLGFSMQPKCEGLVLALVLGVRCGPFFPFVARHLGFCSLPLSSICGCVCIFGPLSLFVCLCVHRCLSSFLSSLQSPSFVSQHGCIVFGFVWVCLLSPSISQVCWPFSPLSAFVLCLLLPPALLVEVVSYGLLLIC